MADVVKYGVQIPNRIFVGGIAFDTKEEELKDFFQKHGKVKDCKIVSDKDGFSRGFGFVTFESKQEAIQTQKLGTVFFNQKKLNLGPAIRQKGVVFNAAQEAANEPVTSAGVYIHPSGYCYTVAPNGVWYFHEGGSPEDTPSQTPVPQGAITQAQLPPAQLPQPQVTQPPIPAHEMSLPTSQGTSMPVQISAPSMAHVPAPISAQSPPAVLPMKLIPADHLTQQNCPVYTHYIVPQSVPMHSQNNPDPSSRYYADGNIIPYYVPQAQPQLPQMSVYPISTPPSQVHPVPPPSVHVIPGQFARQPYPAPHRPEVYQIYSAPYDPSIIEHGPFIHQNNKTVSSSMVKPNMIRPHAPFKRMTVELPPQRTHLRRNGDFFPQNTNGFRVSTGSGGSTPASSSSSSSSGADNYPEQKEDCL